jgi:hypothetical protein
LPFSMADQTKPNRLGLSEIFIFVPANERLGQDDEEEEAAEADRAGRPIPIRRRDRPRNRSPSDGSIVARSPLWRPQICVGSLESAGQPAGTRRPGWSAGAIAAMVLISSRASGRPRRERQLQFLTLKHTHRPRLSPVRIRHTRADCLSAGATSSRPL